MAMPAESYRDQLQALLPPGRAWPRAPESTLGRLLLAFAEALARLDARVDALLDEADPRTTLELLPDWERVAGLPDACAGPPETLQGRRAALVARLTAQGGQTPAFYVALAAALGFEVTITEFRPFRAGQSSAGEPVLDEDWAYAWQVNAPATTVTEFRAGLSGAGEPLRVWGNQPLECAIARAAPVHTTVIFAYAEE